MRTALASLPVYLAAVVWLTWPLAAHVTTHLPATRDTWRYDALYGVWALAHETQALAGAPGVTLEGTVFHPAPHALFYGPTALGALPFFAPPYLATGNAILATNLAFLTGLALTAWMLHVATLGWTGSPLAGAVAATTWLTTPYVMRWWVPTTPYHAVLCWLPAIVALAATPLATLRACVALALLVAVQSLTDVIYVAPAVFAPLGVLALARIARRASR